MPSTIQMKKKIKEKEKIYIRFSKHFRQRLFSNLTKGFTTIYLQSVISNIEVTSLRNEFFRMGYLHYVAVKMTFVFNFSRYECVEYCRYLGSRWHQCHVRDITIRRIICVCESLNLHITLSNDLCVYASHNHYITHRRVISMSTSFIICRAIPTNGMTQRLVPSHVSVVVIIVIINIIIWDVFNTADHLNFLSCFVE